jgi:hypothetical protein
VEILKKNNRKIISLVVKRFELGATRIVTISANVFGPIWSILPLGELLTNNNPQ